MGHRILSRHLVVAALSSASLLGSACSSESDGARLAIDLIDEAIAAVGEQFGDSLEFYEINATLDGVNLFVGTMIDESTPGVVQARYTADGRLVVADDAVPAEGITFGGAAVSFDPETVLNEASEQLSTADPRVFIITAVAPSTPASGPAADGAEEDSSVSYRLVLESQRGGRLVVFLAGDGTILGSDVLD